MKRRLFLAIAISATFVYWCGINNSIYSLNNKCKEFHANKNEIENFLNYAENWNFEKIKENIKWCININAQDDEWISALMLASFKWDIWIVELLINNWANPNQRDQMFWYWFPLIWALKWWNFDIAEYLLKNWANINNTNRNKHTALMEFSSTVFQNQLSNEIKFLVENWADINIKSETFWYTALMLATSSNNIGNVKFLIENWADINIKDKEGNTALEFAKQLNNEEMLNLFKGLEIK